jgi:heme exporter protein D
MKRKGLIVGGLVAALIVLIVTTVSAAGQAELAKVRRATARFHRIEAAQAAGYDLRPNLDYCFDNPGVGGMGYHYINTDILDLALNALRPEAMVYTPGRNGQLRLGAVEYIVPAAEWDAAGHAEPPSVLGHPLHLNEKLGVYVLHAWIWRHNPAGMFEDWNPNVSCP